MSSLGNVVQCVKGMRPLARKTTQKTYFCPLFFGPVIIPAVSGVAHRLLIRMQENIV